MKRGLPRAIVIVAVPILRVSARVILEKGRGWSAVDELILWALSRQPRSAGMLASEVDLPRRVILEIVFRMMRFRLVEVLLVDGTPAFRATAYGFAIVSGGDEIPTLKKKLSRKVSFVADRITGTVFPKREVRVENQSGVAELRERGADVREVSVTGASLRTTPAQNVERFQAVLNADESLVYFDGDTLVERDNEYMIITADGADLRGLPPKSPTALVREIRSIVNAERSSKPFRLASLIVKAQEPVIPTMVDIEFNNVRDLIVGGEQHGNKLLEILSTAKRRIFIHSTFVKANRFNALSSALRGAVRRGARIDIFWGAGYPDEPRENILSEAVVMSKSIAADDVMRGRITVHLRSTGSHSKMLLSDDGAEGWVGLVGSCNWLFSGFDRFELSARLTSASALAEIADRFSRLVARPGFRPEIGGELYLLSRNWRSPSSQGGNFSAGIVAGPMHEAILRQASGQATDRFLIATDRLGNSAFPNAIVPAEVFANRTGKTPLVVYGQTSGALENDIIAAQTSSEALTRGVRLLEVPAGFHAKFLLWDDDNIVITSFNWGSASIGPDNIDGEIGIYLKGPGIAKCVYEQIKDSWSLEV
jgi:cardiolipin synthase